MLLRPWIRVEKRYPVVVGRSDLGAETPKAMRLTDLTAPLFPRAPVTGCTAAQSLGS